MLEPRPARIVATDAPTPRDAPVTRATRYPDVFNFASTLRAHWEPRTSLRCVPPLAVRARVRGWVAHHHESRSRKSVPSLSRPPDSLRTWLFSGFRVSGAVFRQHPEAATIQMS